MRHPDRTIAQILEEFGFAIVRDTGKHFVARTAAGAQMAVPRSPSENFRLYQNVRRDCRRAIREAYAVR